MSMFVILFGLIFQILASCSGVGHCELFSNVIDLITVLRYTMLKSNVQIKQ